MAPAVTILKSAEPACASSEKCTCSISTGTAASTQPIAAIAPAMLLAQVVYGATLGGLLQVSGVLSASGG